MSKEHALICLAGHGPEARQASSVLTRSLGARRSRSKYGCLLSYALFRADPVFILGQSAGMIVYFRNLVLLRQRRLVESTG